VPAPPDTASIAQPEFDVALAYQAQVELIMNAPTEESHAALRRRERLATAAVILAIAVSLCGACVVIVEASPRAAPIHASASE
jgi:hypothetical protein